MRKTENCLIELLRKNYGCFKILEFILGLLDLNDGISALGINLHNNDNTGIFYML